MKRIVILVISILFGFTLIRCKNNILPKRCIPDYPLDRIIVEIKEEYTDRFLNREFTIADFCYENVESFDYYAFFEGINMGMLVIYLKKHGVIKVHQAIKHFETLDFVLNAEKKRFAYIDDF